jgi:hypothetical protein
VSRRVNELETLHGELDAELGGLFLQLPEYNDGFEVLQRLEGSNGNLSKRSWRNYDSCWVCTAAKSKSDCRRERLTLSASAGGRCTGGAGRRRRSTGPSSIPWPTGPTPAMVSSWGDLGRTGRIVVDELRTIARGEATLVGESGFSFGGLS